jgi:glutathione synthase/RimK-type ligase-like ATP-grasp enzyme
MAMRPRVALATYEIASTLAPDDRALLPALTAVGVDAEPTVWSSEEVVWETFDAVIIRSCWDYHLRIGEFRGWLDRLDASRIPTWNPPELVLWNSNKRYLLDLAARGVATIPTTLIPRGSLSPSSIVESIIDAGGPEDTTRFVLKPAISASGFETHALRVPLDSEARATIERVTSLGDALVQPFAEEIPRDGEFSLMFIDGAFSHAAIKRAAANEFRVQTEHGGRVDPVDVSPALVEQAARVIATLPEVPLYARVDGFSRDGAFLLMELELIEPNLFLEQSVGAADRLAAAIRARIDQS